MTKAELSRIVAAKYKLEDYLKLKGVKDWWIIDAQTAQQTTAISTFKVWESWRNLADIVEKETKK